MMNDTLTEDRKSKSIKQYTERQLIDDKMQMTFPHVRSITDKKSVLIRNFS